VSEPTKLPDESDERVEKTMVSGPDTLSGCPKTIARPRKFALGLRLVLIFILAIVFVEFVRRNIGTFSVVDGFSMFPTFKPDDVVQARTSYSELERGSVVILTDNRGDQVIKRIVGLPGETVTLYRGSVYINRRRLSEPYLPKYTFTFKRNQESEQAIVWQLGDNQYFVLGDNRLESQDSRHYGPVERRQIDQVVNLAANDVKPGFDGVMLSETGKAVRTSQPHPGPPPNRTNRPNANETMP
jgi:signal peptidase I